jgi:hypothetical protein
LGAWIIQTSKKLNNQTIPRKHHPQPHSPQTQRQPSPQAADGTARARSATRCPARARSAARRPCISRASPPPARRLLRRPPRRLPRWGRAATKHGRRQTRGSAAAAAGAGERGGRRGRPGWRRGARQRPRRGRRGGRTRAAAACRRSRWASAVGILGSGVFFLSGFPFLPCPPAALVCAAAFHVWLGVFTCYHGPRPTGNSLCPSALYCCLDLMYVMLPCLDNVHV